MSTKYSIKDLERLSGIKAHTLRIWEQRYDILVPERTDTNIRYYSNSDLKKILNIDSREDSFFHTYNLGSGNGYSLLQIIKKVEHITGQRVKFEFVPSNKGESSFLISDISKAQTELSFTAKLSDLETIIRSSLKWYLR